MFSSASTRKWEEIGQICFHRNVFRGTFIRQKWLKRKPPDPDSFIEWPNFGISKMTPFLRTAERSISCPSYRLGTRPINILISVGRACGKCHIKHIHFFKWNSNKCTPPPHCNLKFYKDIPPLCITASLFVVLEKKKTNNRES